MSSQTTTSSTVSPTTPITAAALLADNENESINMGKDEKLLIWLLVTTKFSLCAVTDWTNQGRNWGGALAGAHPFLNSHFG